MPFDDAHTHDSLDRRRFLGLAGLGAAALAARPSRPALAQANGRASGRRPVAISSANGLGAVARADDLLRDGADPLDAVVAGVKLVEDDPDDLTVGLGGLPNEEGVVELDASVMHGPTHRAGAVASIRNIKNPAAVAREVARRTDHVLIVGEGARRFARRVGFTEENLLTDQARERWLRWRSTLNRRDDWLQRDEFDLPTPDSEQRSRRDAPEEESVAFDPIQEVLWIDGVPYTTGTIHCSAVTGAGDLAGVTTTSGLSWKIPGRVGDSPIIGAGLYTDNEVGSAGATGRGEAVMQVCGARTAVMRMEMGEHPLDACLHVLKLIVEKTKSKRLLDAQGRPDFNVVMYAVRKDGAYGSACLRGSRQFAVCENGRSRRENCLALLGED